MVNKIENIIRLLIAFVPLVALVGCGEKASELQYRSVRVTSPQLCGGGFVRNYPAIVKESNETSLGFKTAGQIAHVYVKEGDYVRQGQLLATLDAADYQLAVNALQVQYDQMKSEFERVSRLHENKGVSDNEYEKARAGLEQLANQLQANRNKLSYTKLLAPTNGYIQAVNFSKAEMVDAGTQVFSILDDSGLKVEFDVPVSESGVVTPSATYHILLNGERSSAPLRFISKSPKADGNQLYTVKLGIDSRQVENLTPGMNATVVIDAASSTSQPSDGYRLPLRTVINRDGKTSVWVLKADTTVTQRPVTLGGVDADGMAIITSGISADDRIILAGVNSLHEGEKVTVINTASETNAGGLM